MVNNWRNTLLWEALSESNFWNYVYASLKERVPALTRAQFGELTTHPIYLFEEWDFYDLLSHVFNGPEALVEDVAGRLYDILLDKEEEQDE
ncbi:MAG: hypothetical protein M0R03_03440 [Novosphingobium sp.]|nr:hypothetical protein [Novosphingobium sp.]